MFHKKIDQHINQALESKGIENAISVQKKAISSIKSGIDSIIISPEESGKTTALVVALVQLMKAALNDVPRAMVIVENKEEADKMKELFDEIGKHTDLRVHCVYPGPNILKVRDTVYYGTDIVIGTVKRLNELYSYSGLNLNDLQMILIDNADTTIKIELQAQIDRLTEIMPNAQKILFAKKSNDRIERYSEKYMARPNIIKDND